MQKEVLKILQTNVKGYNQEHKSQAIHEMYKERIEGIMTAYCDIDDYGIDDVMRDLTKLIE